MTYKDGRPVEGKGVGRKVIDRVETYDSELSGKDFAYDGEKSLFTVGSLPCNKLEFTVVLEDVQSNRYTIRVCDSFILGILYYCQFISNSSKPNFCVETMEIVALMSVEVQMRVTARKCGDHITPTHLKWRLALLQKFP